ncbi:hypothetical protein [Ascidiimonas aurantiaca]|uniref:hypothetical protein n=1 Tax=Ascidiimonas aurantiaca TaxID=1685432 RepID=UPI0030ED5E83
MLPISYKAKQFLSLLIKLFIVIGAGVSIYFNLNTRDLHALWGSNSLLAYRFFSFSTLCVLGVFTLVNWALECHKWQILASVITPVSFTEAVRQSLIAFTASLLTPNRIGEFGIKPLFFTKDAFKKGVLLTIIHHFSQFTATLLFGFLGFLWLKPMVILLFPSLNIPGLFEVVLPVILILIWLLPVNKLIRLKQEEVTKVRVPYYKSMALSGIRYLIFTHQFLFLISLTHTAFNYLELIAVISGFYLLISALPVIAFMDVVIKGGVAVWWFGFFGVNKTDILLIITVMWVFNFVFPAIAGSLLLRKYELRPLTVISRKV